MAAVRRPERDHYDVIVVGAGPSGLATAIRCAKDGWRTALVSSRAARELKGNRREPSESVHPGIATLLRELDCVAALTQASRGTYDGIWTGETFAELGRDEAGPWSGHHIDRRVFDQTLADAARTENVEFIEEHADYFIEAPERVGGLVTRSGRHIHARFTVDASGRAQLAVRRWEIPRTFFSPPLVARTGMLHGLSNAASRQRDPVFVPGATGWTWIAPEEDGACTVTQVTRKGAEPLALPRGARWIGNRRGADVRWRLASLLAVPGLVIVGDAGGLLDPGAGRGVLFALWSGIMASHTITRCLRVQAGELAFLGQYAGWFSQSHCEHAERLRRRYRELSIAV